MTQVIEAVSIDNNLRIIKEKGRRRVNNYSITITTL